MSQALATYTPTSLYREQEIQAMRPEQLVLVTYRIGLKALRKKDRRLAIRVLSELVGGLNFEAGEIAGRLLVLYDYMLRQVREGRFEVAEKMLSELHDTWQKVVETADVRSPSGSSG
jgi:flagellin-specific chaperone FliS